MSSIEFLGAELHARRSNIGIMGLGKEGKIKKKKKKKISSYLLIIDKIRFLLMRKIQFT